MGAVTFWVDGIPVVVDDRTYSFDSTLRPVSPAAFKTAGDPAEIWRTQPMLRIVTEFLATNIAQVPLHAFERAANGDRERLDRKEPLSRLLRSPDPRRRQTPFDWMRTLVLDVCIHDRYCAQVFSDDTGDPGGFRMVRLPPQSWRFVRGSTGAPESISATRKDGSEFRVPLDGALWVDGFPSDEDTSPMSALAGILAEDRAAAEFRAQLWANGGRWSTWVERPADAPPWTDVARNRFKEGLASFTGSGGRAGGGPLFEEGMKLHSIDPGVTPEKGQQLETRKFMLALFANAFMVPPEMFMGGTYSSVAAFREQLYGDVLGSWFRRLNDAINVRLLPIVTPRIDDVYVEFNVHEKLRMAFGDQARIFQTMVGAPVMTRKEARERLNLPYLDGTDELIVPLNVIEGGQASPTDSGTQNEGPQNQTEFTYV